MRGSKSESTTCRRKGRLLSFQSNSTATSDIGAQKLGDDVWHESESIANKVAAKSTANECDGFNPFRDLH